MCNQARHMLLEAHKRHVPHQLGRIHLHNWPTALAPLGGNRLQLLLMVVAGLADETEELCGLSFAHKRLAINRGPLRRVGYLRRADVVMQRFQPIFSAANLGWRGRGFHDGL